MHSHRDPRLDRVEIRDRRSERASGILECPRTGFAPATHADIRTMLE
jgi:hypothetical protein